MTLRYKELENISKLNSTKWVPEGTPNLYALARGKGSVFWIVRISHNKKRSVITIGQWPEIKAEIARALTPSIKILIKQGFSETAIKNAIQITLDPRKVLSIVEGQKVSGNGPTADFESVATEWYENHLSGGLSDGPYKKQVIQQLKDHVFPSLGKRPINTIKRKEIVTTLRDLWMSKKPTAVKIRGNIERIFDYAIDNELRDDNPTPLPRSMPTSQHQINHFTALAYERAPELWEWLHNRPRMGPQTRVGLSLAILLGKRTIELRKMRWQDIDFDKAIWTTPAEHMKKRKPHRQPLPSQALELLRYMREFSSTSELVLANQKGKALSENAMLFALKRFDNITTHGFRATLGSWCSENGVSKSATNHLKAHQPKYMDAAYDRSDLLEERRTILQDWANFVTSKSSNQ